MSRPRYTFRPSMQLDSHRKAWEHLQSVPEGQRNEFLVRAILHMREKTVLEETLRSILREEFKAICFQPEHFAEKKPERESSASPIPQKMMSFLDSLMRDE